MCERFCCSVVDGVWMMMSVNQSNVSRTNETRNEGKESERMFAAML